MAKNSDTKTEKTTPKDEAKTELKTQFDKKGIATTDIFNEATGRVVLSMEEYNDWTNGGPLICEAHLRVMRFMKEGIFATAERAEKTPETLLVMLGIAKATKPIEKILAHGAEASADGRMVRAVRQYDGIGPRIARVVAMSFGGDAGGQLAQFGIELEKAAASELNAALSEIQAKIAA